MDKVKAIEVLKPLVESYVDHANISMKEEDDNIVEALEMAIEALKYSEIPNGSDDTISRQAAIDALDMAIERYDEMAEEYRKKADIERNDYMDMRDDAYEARQLAQWLNELKYLRGKIEQLTIKPEQRWIPCSERLPSETVIATVETKTFKHRYVCEAVWIPRWTWKASSDAWEDCSEYKEDDDEYYVLEGWYERVHNWDEYAYVAIDDNVIAWMPIPIPYCGGNGE